MSKRVYTIGHSSLEAEALLALLRQHRVEALGDVRSVPFSRFTPQFNRDLIDPFLVRHKLRYVFLGEELGARRAESQAYEGPKARYELIARCPAFQRGLDRVCDGADRISIALMCAEKDPLTCHRCILVARHMALRGVEVEHILEGGAIETAAQAESRLMKLTGHPPGDLFRSREELLAEAYRVQGERICFSREDDAVREVA